MDIDNRMHDACNCSPTKHFTQIPNGILRNSSLSFKAKGVLCLLLSNSEGWVSYIEAVSKHGTEGIAAITTGVHELEKAGYLWRVSYVDKYTKAKKGSFWAYTDKPGEFKLDYHRQWMENNDLEIWSGSKKLDFNKEKPNIENQDMGNSDMGNQRLRIYKSKNTKNTENINNNKKINKKVLGGDENINTSKKENIESFQKTEQLAADRKTLLPYIELFPRDWQRESKFRTAWAEWVQHRKEIKNQLTELSASKLVNNKLLPIGLDKAIYEINRAIESGWRGIFPEKQQSKHSKQDRPNNGVFYRDRETQGKFKVKSEEVGSEE